MVVFIKLKKIVRDLDQEGSKNSQVLRTLRKGISYTKPLQMAYKCSK